MRAKPQSSTGRLAVAWATSSLEVHYHQREQGDFLLRIYHAASVTRT